MAKGSTLTAIADEVRIIKEALTKSPALMPRVARAALDRIEELAKRSADREAGSAEPETKT